jgi:hypothetical protein
MQSKKQRGYWKLKEEAIDRTLWRTRLEEVVDLSSDNRMNECVNVEVCLNKILMKPDF